MLLSFSIGVPERPPVWERVVHSVNCVCLSWALVKFVCVLLSLLILRVGCGMSLH